VRQRDIRRLYETDAPGIHDEELIDEVGYGLLVRWGSFITAVESVAGIEENRSWRRSRETAEETSPGE
jgi:hypothetical protein